LNGRVEGGRPDPDPTLRRCLFKRELEKQKIAVGYRKREDGSTEYLLEEAAISAYSESNGTVQVASEYDLFFEDESEFEFRLGRSKKLATADYIRCVLKHFHDETKITRFHLYWSSYWSKGLAPELEKEFQCPEGYEVEFHAVTEWALLLM
jgi:hypothetical protein